MADDLKLQVMIGLHLPRGKLWRFCYFIFSVGTAMVAYNVNVGAGSSCPLFWSIVDFFVTFLAWGKWLVCHQVNVSLIKHTFAWFLK